MPQEMEGSGWAYTRACPLPQAVLGEFSASSVACVLTGSIFNLLRAQFYITKDYLAQPMTEDDVLSEFRASEALLEGHFKLSSGRHSAHYLQCARVLMDPMRASRLAAAIAAKIPRELRSKVDKVVSPAMGGVIIGHEMGRALGTEAIFLERPTGTFELRRGFRLEQGDKVLVVEDVVTTGLSSKEAMAAVAEAGGEVVALAALVDRTDEGVRFDVPYFPLIQISFPTFAEDNLPAELAAIPVTKPGSRK